MVNGYFGEAGAHMRKPTGRAGDLMTDLAQLLGLALAVGQTILAYWHIRVTLRHLKKEGQAPD